MELILLALDLTSAKNRRVLECGRGVCPPPISYLLQSKAVMTVYSPLLSCSSQSRVCNAILLDVVHLVIAIGTVPYALCAVAIPWSQDHCFEDTSMPIF